MVTADGRVDGKLVKRDHGKQQPGESMGEALDRPRQLQSCEGNAFDPADQYQPDSLRDRRNSLKAEENTGSFLVP